LKVKSNVKPVPGPWFHIPSPEQGGHGPEVVEWNPLTQTQWIVSPTWIVDVLLPLTWSTKLFPPCPTLTVNV
jgi:hypothetical protein